MVNRDQEGYVRLFANSDQVYVRRQDAPTAYGIVPVAYVSSPQFILNSTGIWDGRVKAVQVDPLTAIDIDNPSDFYLAELILRDRQCKQVASIE